MREKWNINITNCFTCHYIIKDGRISQTGNQKVNDLASCQAGRPTKETQGELHSTQQCPENSVEQLLQCGDQTI